MSKSILAHYIINCFQLFQSTVESNMDDISEDDMCDSQFNDIGKNYLTESQFREMTMEWCESDTQFNDIVEDWSQGDSFSQSEDESTIQQKYQGVGPEKEKDIHNIGVKWKPSTRREVEKYIDRNITFQNIIFQLVYKVRLVKVGEEEREVALFHSGNRRVLNMYHFDKVYEEQIKEINEDFETYISEKTTEWKIDLIESVFRAIQI